MSAVSTGNKSPSNQIRVLIAEDQTMLRGALAALLSLEPDITVLAQASNGREAHKMTLTLAPDVVVTDIEMPEMTGLEFAAALKDTSSQARGRLSPDGPPSAEIAPALRPSEGPVRNYLSEAIAKLGAANRIDAARIARARGWL